MTYEVDNNGEIYYIDGVEDWGRIKVEEGKGEWMNEYECVEVEGNVWWDI